MELILVKLGVIWLFGNILIFVVYLNFVCLMHGKYLEKSRVYEVNLGKLIVVVIARTKVKFQIVEVCFNYLAFLEPNSGQIYRNLFWNQFNFSANHWHICYLR